LAGTPAFPAKTLRLCGKLTPTFPAKTPQLRGELTWAFPAKSIYPLLLTASTRGPYNRGTRSRRCMWGVVLPQSNKELKFSSVIQGKDR